MRKVTLGKTYITKDGSEFTPIKLLERLPKRMENYPGLGVENFERKYQDESGKQFKKSELLTEKPC